MTKKKQTKRALLSSIVSLILCFTMLLGTTFAWFTDTASTGRNVIKSGNLDIELYYKTSLEDEEWKAIGEDTEIFSYDKWEPGYTQVVYLKTANKGSLALKYNVAASVYKETLGKTKDGADIKLSDYLKAGYLEVAAWGDALSAEEMMAITVENTFENSRPKFAAFAEGTMSNFEQYGGKNLNEFDAASGVVLLPGEENVGVLAITMPTTVTNEANHNGTDIPEIELGLTVVATQHAEEYDSFGNDYDAAASIPTVINTKEELAEVFKEEDGKMTLSSDITLMDIPFYNDKTATENVTIDGNGKTVTMTASSADTFAWDETSTIPLFGNVFSSANGSTVTVNDLTLAGTIQSNMLGNYVSGNAAAQSNFNTVLNNVNIVNTNVVSLSAGISPAVCVYGNAELNNCNIYGTKLSGFDTDPQWPVYDLAAVNYTDTKINGGKIGSIYTWNHAKVEINGAQVDSIFTASTYTKEGGIVVGSGSTVGTIKANYSQKVSITIKDGAVVDTLDLTGITGAKDGIVIEDGAAVKNIIVDGQTVDFDTWKNS